WYQRHQRPQWSRPVFKADEHQQKCQSQEKPWVPWIQVIVQILGLHDRTGDSRQDADLAAGLPRNVAQLEHSLQTLGMEIEEPSHLPEQHHVRNNSDNQALQQKHIPERHVAQAFVGVYIPSTHASGFLVSSIPQGRFAGPITEW